MLAPALAGLFPISDPPQAVAANQRKAASNPIQPTGGTQPSASLVSRITIEAKTAPTIRKHTTISVAKPLGKSPFRGADQRMNCGLTAGIFKINRPLARASAQGWRARRYNAFLETGLGSVWLMVPAWPAWVLIFVQVSIPSIERWTTKVTPTLPCQLTV